MFSITNPSIFTRLELSKFEFPEDFDTLLNNLLFRADLKAKSILASRMVFLRLCREKLCFFEIFSFDSKNRTIL